MRNFLILLAIGVVVYFVFLRDTRFDAPIQVQGETYEKTKKVSRGGVDNVFYTKDGTKMEYASAFVQLYVFDDEVPDERRRQALQQVRNTYRLTESLGEGSYFGTYKQSGLKLAAYGTDIRIDARPSMVVFTETIEDESQAAEARRRANDIIRDLARIEAQIQ